MAGRRMPGMGEPDGWKFFASIMVVLAATEAAIVVNVALGRLDDQPSEVAGAAALVPLLLFATAGFWKAHRFSLVDVPMTMSWWHTSAAKKVVVVALLASGVVEAAVWVATMKLVHAMTAVGLVALAVIWWRGFPDDGKWDDVPAPDPNPAISKPGGEG